MFFFVPIIFAKMFFLHSADKEKSLSFQRCSMISSSSRRPQEILVASVYVSFDQHLMLQQLQFSKLCCNKMRISMIQNLKTLPLWFSKNVIGLSDKCLRYDQCSINLFDRQTNLSETFCLKCDVSEFLSSWTWSESTFTIAKNCRYLVS